MGKSRVSWYRNVEAANYPFDPYVRDCFRRAPLAITVERDFSLFLSGTGKPLRVVSRCRRTRISNHSTLPLLLRSVRSFLQKPFTRADTPGSFVRSFARERARALTLCVHTPAEDVYPLKGSGIHEVHRTLKLHGILRLRDTGRRRYVNSTFPNLSSRILSLSLFFSLFPTLFLCLSSFF